MPGEEQLIRAAGGDFALILLAVLIVSILGGFFFMMRFIMENNTKSNNQIIERLDKIVESVASSQEKTAQMFCDKLEKHDIQAKAILDTARDTKTMLENRPCINGNKH